MTLPLFVLAAEVVDIVVVVGAGEKVDAAVEDTRVAADSRSDEYRRR